MQVVQVLAMPSFRIVERGTAEDADDRPPTAHLSGGSALRRLHPRCFFPRILYSIV